MNLPREMPSRLWPWLLAAAILIAFFLHLQGVPLFDLDEGAFSEATREMLVRHDFLTTYLNGVPRYAKPILIYWLQAASVAIFGVHTFAFRLPSSLAATAWVLSVFAFVRPRLGREAAFAASLVTTCSIAVAIIGRAAIADALLNLFIALSMFDVYRYFETGSAAPRNRTFLWMALGFLTKGPIAMLAVPVSLLFFALRRHWQPWLRAAFSPVGWAFFLVVAAPWYVAEYLHQGKAFIDGFFLKNNIGRYSSPMQHHDGDWLYYVAATLLDTIPFSGWVIRTVVRMRTARGEPLDQFLWIWFWFVLVFFTFSATKLPHYMLYGCTPLFILLGRHREALHSRWLAFVPAVAFVGVVLSLPAIARHLAARAPNGYYRMMLEQGPAVFNFAYYVVPAVVMVALLVLVVWPRWPVWQRTLIAGVLSVLVLMQTLMPAIGALQQQPVKHAALLAKRLGGPAVMWGINMPSFSVYRQAVTPRQPPKPGDLVFIRADHLHRLARLGHYKVLYDHGGVALARFLGPHS